MRLDVATHTFAHVILVIFGHLDVSILTTKPSVASENDTVLAFGTNPKCLMHTRFTKNLCKTRQGH